MKETRKILYVKGVFVCPKCRQSYVQEKWIEEMAGSLSQVRLSRNVDGSLR
jgi:predicted nucleic-acid-binding Zn-ribbon protein